MRACARTRHLAARAGIKTCVVSNFDTRLRPIMDGLGLSRLFDAIVISAEVGAEKPNPVIFEAACAVLGVKPWEAVHVGDDRRCAVPPPRPARAPLVCPSPYLSPSEAGGAGNGNTALAHAAQLA